MGTMDEDLTACVIMGRIVGQKGGNGRGGGGGGGGVMGNGMAVERQERHQGYHDCYFDHLLTCPRVIVDALS